MTSVTDRFRLRWPAGAKNGAWGDMRHFLAYTAVLNPWFPGAVVPALAILVTALGTTHELMHKCPAREEL